MRNLLHRLRGFLYRSFVAGLLLWLPVWITYVIVHFIFTITDNILKALPTKYQPEQLIGMHIPGLGLLVTLVILVVTGLFVTNLLGRHLVELWERLLARIPLIRSIYSAVKKVLDTILQPKGQAFRKVLLIEYPRRGIWSIGFLTSNNFAEPPLDEEMVTVFIPTTPNPTSGYLTVVPKKDTRELRMNVEEALRLVISLGVVPPDTTSSSNEGAQYDKL